MAKQFILGFFLLIFIQVTAQDDIVKVGQQFPSFEVLSQNGQTFSSKSLNGKVVLINFFATWCGPCLAELPVLEEKVWNKYKSNPKFQLLIIGRDHTESEILAFKTKRKFDLPMYPDKSKLIYSLFAKKYIPRSYLIDETGKVVYSSMGYTSSEFEKMLNMLDELLK